MHPDRFELELEDVIFDGSDSGEMPCITLTKVTGVFDGVSMRREQVDRPTAHGQFWSPGFLSGRSMTLEGEIYTTSADDQELWIGHITGLLANGEKGRLYRHGPEELWIDVARIGAPEITIDRYGLLARYQLQLWAPDPRWYGRDNEEGPGTSLEIAHYGNMPAASVFTVRGNSPDGYRIDTVGDRSYRVTNGPGAGDVDEIDMATGWIKRNGEILFGAVSRYETWLVPPHVSWLHTLTPAAGGTVTMSSVTPDTIA